MRVHIRGSLDVTIEPDPVQITNVEFFMEEGSPLECIVTFNVPMNQEFGLVNPGTDWRFSDSQAGLIWIYTKAEWIDSTRLKLISYSGQGLEFPQPNNVVYQHEGAEDRLQSVAGAFLNTGYTFEHNGLP